MKTMQMAAIAALVGAGLAIGALAGRTATAQPTTLSPGASSAGVIRTGGCMAGFGGTVLDGSGYYTCATPTVVCGAGSNAHDLRVEGPVFLYTCINRSIPK